MTLAFFPFHKALFCSPGREQFSGITKLAPTSTSIIRHNLEECRKTGTHDKESLLEHAHTQNIHQPGEWHK